MRKLAFAIILMPLSHPVVAQVTPDVIAHAQAEARYLEREIPRSMQDVRRMSDQANADAAALTAKLQAYQAALLKSQQDKGQGDPLLSTGQQP